MLWPPPESSEGSCALKDEIILDAKSDFWTDPDLKSTAVKDVVWCGDDSVVLLLEGGTVDKCSLVVWPFATDKLHGVRLEGFPESPGNCSQLWLGGGRSFFTKCDGCIYRADLPPCNAWPGSGPVVLQAAKVFVPPPRVSSLQCSTNADGSLCCAMLVSPEKKTSTGPMVIRAGDSYLQTPAAKLCIFDAQEGLRAVADAPRLSEQLVMSRGWLPFGAPARRICVWKTMLNEVPEEAERGEFLACEIQPLEARNHALHPVKEATIQLTSGAGRVGGAAVSDDGTLMLLQANFSNERPITTHMAMVLLFWDIGAAAPRAEKMMLQMPAHNPDQFVQPLPYVSVYDPALESEHAVAFNFFPDSDEGRCFWITTQSGVDAKTHLCKCDRDHGVFCKALPSPILSRMAAWHLHNVSPPGHPGVVAKSHTIVFGTEEEFTLAQLALVSFQFSTGESKRDKAPELPQGLIDPGMMKVEKVVWKHRGDNVTGLLFERAKPACPNDAPLLVHAHGGPAIAVLKSLRSAFDPIRYPYRHLLHAGYRIFVPLFRGTLGFGNKWAQGNIGAQGALDNDLGDIMSGLDWLHESHARLKGTIKPERTGIFGGSYGGYMTLRAMSSAPDRFGAGVALYGFVHNRWMTYEGGDFTYEDEYLQLPDAGEFTWQESETKSRGLTEVSDTRERADSGGAASDIWPPKESSDCFNNLHLINKPLLLMHGEKDDICPLSQSQVAFHMLEKQQVPTGLIVYPDEGHGFDKPEHQRDRDRRILLWFHEHMPAAGPWPQCK